LPTALQPYLRLGPRTTRASSVVRRSLDGDCVDYAARPERHGSDAVRSELRGQLATQGLQGGQRYLEASDGVVRQRGPSPPNMRMTPDFCLIMWRAAALEVGN
jgi:hypothetical protein